MDVKIPSLSERLEAFELPESTSAAHRAMVRLGGLTDRYASIYKLTSRQAAGRKQLVPELLGTRDTVFDEEYLSKTYGPGRYRIELRMRAPGRPVEVFEIWVL